MSVYLNPDEPEVTAGLGAEFGLTADEYKTACEIVGRTPTWTELGIFSVMWSEHCSYKSSRVHLKRLPTEGPQVVLGPGENAGAVDIGDGLCAVFKMESHNHPSFIEPVQGAATGVGGILRDVFTMGARPVALLNSLRFGSLSRPQNRYLFSHVVEGISHYGNCVGVPTVGGEVYFNDIYNQNCLVNAMCVGIARSDRLFMGVAKGVGNPVMYVGAKTGRDGIHGATMASEEFGENEEKRPTVQVGDPFTEKLLIEACMELMAQDHIEGIQDMGAAGLTSSSCEMASRAGTGIEMILDDVPCREEGMTPYEMMLSESQERMLLVARPGHEDAVRAIFEKWDLEAAVVGKVTDDGMLRLKFQGNTVCEIPVHPLAEQAPRYERPMAVPEYLDALQAFDPHSLAEPKDFNEVLLALLAAPTIASKEWVFGQYDHMVQVNTEVPPGSDAAVLRIRDENGNDTGRHLAMTTDCNSRHCMLNPYTGAALAVAECARNIVASGGRPLGITDCMNFGNPERPDIMWQFAMAVEGISDACKALDAPVVSGNVSLYNETLGQGIYPTPTIGMVGIVENGRSPVTASFKDDGDIIVLVGTTADDLGGSEYLAVWHSREQGLPPQLDLTRARATNDAVLKLMDTGCVKSCHDLAEGGLAVALAESAIGGRIGCQVGIESNGLRRDEVLFSESPSRFILTVSPANRDVMTETLTESGVAFAELGWVRGDRIQMGIDRKLTVDVALAAAADTFKNSIAKTLEGGAGS
ncbi:MAG: phosphoribosylformylglycinamidine synthase subunit PurL [Nitrospirota bacterium]|nr:phosphoribosylformylglycinamidine synthase subunit PurL [Nitrospirota bacterium]